VASTVTIRDDRMLVRDGHPLFVLQGRHRPVGATLADLAEAGFNCFRYTFFGTLGSEPETLPDDLHGLLACVYLYDCMNLRADPSYESQLTDAVTRWREHPALLAYETYNEPAWRPDIPQKVNQTADDLATGYRRVRELDPHHPIHLGHSASATVDALREYNRAADIIGCNPYPVMPVGMRRHWGIRPDGRALGSPDQGLSAVGDYTGKMVQVGESTRPVWMQLQAMAWEDFYSPAGTRDPGPDGPDPSAILYPTHAQMRYMAFADTIHGATGLLFSMHNVPKDSEVWQDIRRLAGELRGLRDILAARSVDLPLQASYANLGYSIWKGVETLAKEHDGRCFLFAANSAFDPAEVTWKGFGDVACLRVLGEDREVPAQSGAASDRFEPYDVHVYELVSR